MTIAPSSLRSEAHGGSITPTPPKIGRLRLRLAIVLTWTASRIAPAPMRSVFSAYGGLLADFDSQLKMGRRYGIITAVWGFDEGGRDKAGLMQDAAADAGSAMRAWLERKGS